MSASGPFVLIWNGFSVAGMTLGCNIKIAMRRILHSTPGKNCITKKVLKTFFFSHISFFAFIRLHAWLPVAGCRRNASRTMGKNSFIRAMFDARPPARSTFVSNYSSTLAINSFVACYLNSLQWIHPASMVVVSKNVGAAKCMSVLLFSYYYYQGTFRLSLLSLFLSLSPSLCAKK